MRCAVTIVVSAATLGLFGWAPAFAGESAPQSQIAQARNPCGAKNPCAARNPCSAKNPCAVGGRIDPKMVTRPKGVKLASGAEANLLKEGQRLWRDTTLSTNGLSCQTCHQGNAAFNASFAKPYPHPVAMASRRAGLKQVDADEMVQFCMIVPMAAKPLKWDSRELAALTAYTREVQKGFKPSAGNPCAAKNPCSGKK